MTKIQPTGASVIAAGIKALLADDSGGKRTLGWLHKRSGIPYSTLKTKLRVRPGSFDTDELFAIADALGVDIRDIVTAGEAALDHRDGADNPPHTQSAPLGSSQAVA